MTTTSTEQSDSAAERSAHVSRGPAETLSSLKPVVVQLPDGTWKLRVLHELEKENKKLRRLVRCLVEEDPYDGAADGVTVLDVWRKEALETLGAKE
jgi:hypothetical protein